MKNLRTSLCLVILSFTVSILVGQDIQQMMQDLQTNLPDSLKINYYKGLSRYYLNVDLDSAQYFAQAGLDLSERIGDNRGIADFSVYYAFVEMNKGRPAKGLTLLKDKLYYLQSNADFINGEIYIIEWMANIYREINQLDSATHYYTIMLDRSKGSHFHNLIGVHSGLGQLYQQQQFYESSIYHFQVADSICRINKVDNNVCTGCRSSTGQMLLEIGDYENANKYFQLAQKEYESRNENYLIHELKIFQADLKIREDNINEALVLADVAVEYFRKDSSIVLWTKALQRLFTAYTRLRDIENGEKVATELLTLTYILQDSLRMADAHTKYAYVTAQKGLYDAALASLEKADIYSTPYNDLVIKQAIYKNYATIYDLIGDHKKALDVQTAWSAINAEMNRQMNARAVKELEIAYDIKNKNQEIELLTTQNQLIEQQRINQRNILWGGLVSFSILSIFLFLLFKNKQKVNQKLRQVDKIKARLFANISHELRTPITLIQGPVQQLLKKDNLSAEVKEQLQMVNRNTTRLTRLVNNVNDLSKLEAGKSQLHIRPSYLLHHLQQITNSFLPLASTKSIRFGLDLNMRNELYYYDPEHLETMVYNLLSNAFKFTINGSVNLHAQISGPNLVLSVIDTGIGIQKENQHKIFDRYDRGSKQMTASDGIGLGLALIDELVKLHHGTIEIDSSENKGSTFTISIPVNMEYYTQKGYEILQQHNTDLTLTPTTDIINNTVTNVHLDEPLILLVEDNADMRTYLDRVFNEDYRIILAENGQLGWDLAERYIPDLIISDLMMPVMDGNEFLQKIKEDPKTCHIPFIMLTANHLEEAKLGSLKYGADDFMTKPFSEAELQIKVQNQIKIRSQLLEKYKSNGLNPHHTPPLAADQDFWNRLETVIKTNLGNVHFTTEEFAKSMLMSRMQLHRKLKAITNMSATTFIRTQRLKAAAQMMKENRLSVSEVAYSVGFSSPFYFSKCFKEMYNQVPKEYTG